jgi:hypothetical protein
MATLTPSAQQPRRACEREMPPELGDPFDIAMVKEQYLREEVRAIQAHIVNLLRWGVTVLVSMQTVLFFVRRDVATTMAANPITANVMQIPLRRYLLGTLFLMLLAVIFYRLTMYALTRLAHYRAQLMIDAVSGIQDLPGRPGAQKWIFFLYFVFPLTDLLFRAYLTFGLK